MVEINTDILYRISEFITPNPLTYCRLAEVNWDFRHVFESDRCWRKLDAYNDKTAVKQWFLRRTLRKTECIPLLKFAWTIEHCDWTVKQISRCTTNRYVWLGLLLRTDAPLNDLKSMKHLAKVLLYIDPTKWEKFDDPLTNSKEDFYFAMLAAHLNQKVDLDQFDGKDLDRLVTKVIRNPIHHATLPEDEWTPERFDIAMKINPLNYFENRSWGQKYLKDRDLFIRWLEYITPENFCEQYAHFVNDRGVLKAIFNSPFMRAWPLSQVPARFHDDKELVLAAITQNPHDYFDAVSPRLQADSEVIFTLIRAHLTPQTKGVWGSDFDKSLLQKIPLDEIDVDAAHELVKVYPKLYHRLRPELKNNRAITGTAIKGLENLIKTEHDFPGFNNFEMTMKILQHNPTKIYGVDKQKPSYRDLLLAALTTKGSILLDLDPQWLNDHGCVFTAIRTCNQVYCLLSRELQYDINIVIEMVRLNGRSLQLVPETFQINRDVILAANRHHQFSTEEILTPMRQDWDLIKEVVAKHGTFDRDLLANREVALLAVKANRLCFRYLPIDYKQNTEFVCEAVAADGLLFGLLPSKHVQSRKVHDSIGRLDIPGPVIDPLNRMFHRNVWNF